MNITELKTALLTYNLKELEKFINGNFKTSNPNEIINNINTLEKLPKTIIELGISKISSYEHWADPARHLSVIGIYVLALVTFYIQSTMSFASEDIKMISVLLGLAFYIFLFIFIAIQLGRLNDRKERLIYLKSLLIVVLKNK